MMLQVQCPHCNVRGQIVFPPLGAIIIGPCPNCWESVLVFGGKVLPLSKEILTKGDRAQKVAHIKNVVMDHLDPKITQLVEQLGDGVLENLHDYKPSATSEKKECPQEISMTEFEKFVKVDLLKIDEGDYFKKHLGGK